MALIVIAPRWVVDAGINLPLGYLESSIVVAFATLFMLGTFLGSISGRFWLWSGLRTLVIALLTAGIILLLGN
jgi:VIT1/CCC1 family predicted Fe2+/Mn2+ transporter